MTEIKTSIIVATFNKEYALPNTLAALGLQIDETMEVIVIDDASRNDPKPIVEKILSSYTKNYNFVRLPQRVGGRKSRGAGLCLTSETSDTIITLAADVMPLSPNLIKTLSERCERGKFALCEVKNIPVPNDVWEYMPFYIERTLENWNMYPSGIRIYQGSMRPDGYVFLFCAAAKKKDLYDLEFDKLSCDLFFYHKMVEANIIVEYLDELKAVHQLHKFVQHPCSEIGTCRLSQSCEQRGVKKL